MLHTWIGVNSWPGAHGFQRSIPKSLSVRICIVLSRSRSSPQHLELEMQICVRLGPGPSPAFMAPNRTLTLDRSQPRIQVLLHPQKPPKPQSPRGEKGPEPCHQPKPPTLTQTLLRLVSSAPFIPQHCLPVLAMEPLLPRAQPFFGGG